MCDLLPSFVNPAGAGYVLQLNVNLVYFNSAGITRRMEVADRRATGYPGGGGKLASRLSVLVCCVIMTITILVYARPACGLLQSVSGL